MHVTTHHRRRGPLPVATVVLVSLATLAAVLVSSTSPAIAAGGGLAGPIAGRYWFSHTAKVGVNGAVVSYTTALRNFDPAAGGPC